MRVLITGAAGFIGATLARLLLREGCEVVGVDDHNAYYDPALKAAREAQLLASPNYLSIRAKIETPGLLRDLFAANKPDVVVHLAAQAGVRHSITHPETYLASNLQGSYELLEAARAHPPRHMLMASSSSVYGGNAQMPYRETDKTDLPLSFYAATKKSNEMMAHSYAGLFALPITMFRFFTVYGPWGRPDMAPHLFTSALFEGRAIKLFNHGHMMRDFTFVDDLVASIRALMDAVPPAPNAASRGPAAEFDSLSPCAPWRVVNIGNGQPVPLMGFVRALEAASGREARFEMLPMQPGDVEATWADTTLLGHLTGTVKRTDIREGAARYVGWFRDYYAQDKSKAPVWQPAHQAAIRQPPSRGWQRPLS